MGLDMYLSERIYIGGAYKHNKVKGSINISRLGKKLDIPVSRLDAIWLEKAYWRKANQIHNWFVENIQKGHDDCKEYYVPVQKLFELKCICMEVLKNPEKAQELLPTQSGFFFGEIGYNESYFDDLRDTLEQLEELNPDVEYYYRSSW